MTYHDFAVELVRAAGARLKSVAKDVVVSHKGEDERDVLTTTDLEINTFLLERIKAAYPDHEVFSEEGSGTTKEGVAYEWFLDPIDGSANFSRGIPHFSVCVGLLHSGVPVAAAVYNPITDELFSFDEGKGAYLNGSPIHVSAVQEPRQAQALFVIGHQPPLWDWGAAVFRSFLENMKKTKSLGSSALDLCFLAAGRADIVVYGTLTTRDAVSAISIVRAAGGEVYTLEGVPVDFSTRRQTIIAAANKSLFAKVLPLLHADLLP